MAEKFDLAVIGGGPGGYGSAIHAKQLGAKVVLIEDREMGGTCLNRGCIPTKSLLHSAEVYHTAVHSGLFGVKCGDVDFDYAVMAARKQTVVKQMRSAVESLVRNSGCVILKGKATFKSRHILEVANLDKVCEIETDKIIIATGSKPWRPNVSGINGDIVLDSDDVLSLNTCPLQPVIVGGGVIGIEFATLYNRLGKKVTIIEMEDNVLPGMDKEISGLMKKSLKARGVEILTGVRLSSVNKKGKTICCVEKEEKSYEIAGDTVIIATGRRANIEGLGLEKLGIEIERGFIKVDDKLETSVKGIYAIGDVTGKSMLAHTALAQGKVAAENTAQINSKMKYNIIPKCVYSSPEIASVGLTEEEARAKGHELKVGRFPVSYNGKALVMGENEGIAKIVSDNKTGEILGAHVIGPRATDMIAEICVSMKLESTIEDLADTIHAHPTVSEIIMEAAHDAMGQSIHKPMV